MLLTLVRHGETDWNRQRRIQGSTDVPLNDTGRDQARASAALLARRSWDAVYTSPLVRASETAAIIADHLGLGVPTPVAALVERSYGASEGFTDTELAKRYPEGVDVPGREAREAVLARALPALQNLGLVHPSGAVIVVSHGGLIRSVLAAVDPAGRHGMSTNGSIHTFAVDEGSLRLIAFNDPLDELSEALGDDIVDQNPLERREMEGGRA